MNEQISKLTSYSSSQTRDLSENHRDFYKLRFCRRDQCFDMSTLVKIIRLGMSFHHSDHRFPELCLIQHQSLKIQSLLVIFKLAKWMNDILVKQP